MNKNACLAIVLCLAVFLLFEFLVFLPRQREQAKWQKKQAELKRKEQEQEQDPKPVGKIEPGEAPEMPVKRKAITEKFGVIRNDVLELRWTNYGAALSEISLIEKTEKGEYRFEGADWENPLKITWAAGEIENVPASKSPRHQYSFLMRENLSALGMDLACRTDLSSITWNVEEFDNSSVTFGIVGDSRIAIKKKVMLPEKGYLFDVEIIFTNPDNVARTTAYEIGGAGGITNESAQAGVNRFVSVLHEGDSVKVTPLRSIVSGGGGGGCLGPCACGGGSASFAFDEDKPLKYAGLDNTYFGLFMMPVDGDGKPLSKEAVARRYKRVEVKPIYAPDPQAPKVKVGEKINACVYFRQVGRDRMNSVSLEPGASQSHNFRVFAGPKLPDITEPAGFGHVYDHDRGWFFWLADLFYWILRFFYAIFRNYGVAIIALTAIIRGGMHPLSRRQTLSMEKYQKSMQAIKPELDALKEKYKNNPKKFSQEQMKLMKERGVPLLPIAGCLPLLLQLPVFIGLWRCLTYSVELRHQPFIPGWISDLSQPDTLGHLPLFGGVPINILPIACIAVMVLQMRLQPKPADAQQQTSQKMMMYIFPVMFGFMFYSLPSGLTLYFFSSTLVGLVEHKLLKKKKAEIALASAAAPGIAPGNSQKPEPPEPPAGKDLPRVSLAKKKKDKKQKKWPYT
ncbi:MAG: YidC/Oxa1 family membrane protein insertase [Planctomycetota bacterium]|jgi:YidC/Oxa1 family membrane protein insertase